MIRNAIRKTREADDPAMKKKYIQRVKILTLVNNSHVKGAAEHLNSSDGVDGIESEEMSDTPITGKMTKIYKQGKDSSSEIKLSGLIYNKIKSKHGKDYALGLMNETDFLNSLSLDELRHLHSDVQQRLNPPDMEKSLDIADKESEKQEFKKHFLDMAKTNQEKELGKKSEEIELHNIKEKELNKTIKDAVNDFGKLSQNMTEIRDKVTDLETEVKTLKENALSQSEKLAVKESEHDALQAENKILLQRIVDLNKRLDGLPPEKPSNAQEAPEVSESNKSEVEVRPQENEIDHKTEANGFKSESASKTHPSASFSHPNPNSQVSISSKKQKTSQSSDAEIGSPLKESLQSLQKKFPEVENDLPVEKTKAIKNTWAEKMNKITNSTKPNEAMEVDSEKQNSSNPSNSYKS